MFLKTLALISHKFVAWGFQIWYIFTRSNFVHATNPYKHLAARLSCRSR